MASTADRPARRVGGRRRPGAGVSPVCVAGELGHGRGGRSTAEPRPVVGRLVAQLARAASGCAHGDGVWRNHALCAPSRSASRRQVRPRGASRRWPRLDLRLEDRPQKARASRLCPKLANAGLSLCLGRGWRGLERGPRPRARRCDVGLLARSVSAGSQADCLFGRRAPAGARAFVRGDRYHRGPPRRGCVRQDRRRGRVPALRISHLLQPAGGAERRLGYRRGRAGLGADSRSRAFTLVNL